MSKRYKIGSYVEIIVTEQGSYAGCFDRACRAALAQAAGTFGADDYGYMKHVEGWERNCCSLRVEFVGMRMNSTLMGTMFYYEFKAVALKHSEEE